MSELTEFFSTASQGSKASHLRIGLTIFTILLAILLGFRASPVWALLPVAGIGAAILIQYPYLGLLAVPIAALFVRVDIPTGSAVILNVTALLLMGLMGIWFLRSWMLRKALFVPSETNRPLLLFLGMAALSILIGNVFWKPSVPRSDSIILVQIAQWVIFALSAGAYWLMGQFTVTVKDLRRFVLIFLAIAGGLAILYVIPHIGTFLYLHVITNAPNRAPFWVLLAALSYGQLCYNKALSRTWRVFLILILIAVMAYIFYWNRESASNRVTVIVVLAVMTWLRWPSIWRIVLPLAVILALTGGLAPTLYEFAGGDAEWQESGGSRISLIVRVLSVTLHNPITGLGPASYRPYTTTEPLKYGQAVWFHPQVNSHNNYVDIFAHTGVIGLGLFLWFIGNMGHVAWRLRRKYGEGFLGGYVHAMIGTWVGIVILMMLADWMLPFVYNIGFSGFQASALVWLFLGGLITVENLIEADMERDES